MVMRGRRARVSWLRGPGASSPASAEELFAYHSPFPAQNPMCQRIRPPHVLRIAAQNLLTLPHWRVNCSHNVSDSLGEVRHVYPHLHLPHSRSAGLVVRPAAATTRCIHYCVFASSRYRNSPFLRPFHWVALPVSANLARAHRTMADTLRRGNRPGDPSPGWTGGLRVFSGGVKHGR